MDANEIAKHNTAESCWVIIHSKVYDVTEYLALHPGGTSLLLRHGGKDATSEYAKIHSPITVTKTLPSDKCLGTVNLDSLQNVTLSPPQKQSSSPSSTPANINLCVNLKDFEPIAKTNISKAAYTYLYSSADTGQSHEDNLQQWSKITYIPRVLKDVSTVDLTTSLLGYKCSMPIFVAPTGLAGLTHSEGELCLLKGAMEKGIHYAPSTYSSIPHQKLSSKYKTLSQKGLSGDNTSPTIFFQLYVNAEWEKTLKTIREAKQLGYKALVITVDTPTVGNRDEDRRLKAAEDIEFGVAPTVTTVTPGGSNSGLSRTLNWSDLGWIREAWQGPVVLKGIQSAEDARLAMEAGVDAIYLSNHGGRQLHSAPSCLATLLRIRRSCPEVMRKCEVWVDGGCFRGGDVLKALCLGAKAVGIGRPFLYAIGAYGLDGFLKAADILRHEMTTTMMLLGATKLADLDSRLVNTAKLDWELGYLGGNITQNLGHSKI